MKMRLCVIALILIPSALRAQPYGDMPLPLILIPGEGWTKLTILPMPPKDSKIAIGDPSTAAAGNGVKFTVNRNKQSLTLAKDAGEAQEIKLPLKEIGAIAISPDKGTLLVADAGSKSVWWFRVGLDGQLSGGENYATLRLRKEEARSEACAIVFDSWGRSYVAMKDGVQVFDPTGRLCGLLPNPSKERPTSFGFDGDNGDTLHLACGSEFWLRKINATWSGFKLNDKK
jgi:sugar lactone lactonase YvrE